MCFLSLLVTRRVSLRARLTGEARRVLGVHEGHRSVPVRDQCVPLLRAPPVLSGLQLLAQPLDGRPRYQRNAAQPQHASGGVRSTGPLTG